MRTRKLVGEDEAKRGRNLFGTFARKGKLGRVLGGGIRGCAGHPEEKETERRRPGVAISSVNRIPG